MFFQYIQAAISKTVYEVIDDEEPYYGELPTQKASGQPAKLRKSAAKIF